MITKETAEKLIIGDESALDEIITKMTPIISGIIYNISRGSLSSADIEEITADTFITLWYGRDKIISERIEGYICTIAKNKTKNKIRDTKFRQAIDIEEVVVEDDMIVSGKIETEDAERALNHALDELGEPDREIILRYFFYYQTSSKIGTELGMNPQTVRTKIKRSKEKLKKLLVERGFIR